MHHPRDKNVFFCTRCVTFHGQPLEDLKRGVPVWSQQQDIEARCKEVCKSNKTWTTNNRSTTETFFSPAHFFFTRHERRSGPSSPPLPAHVEREITCCDAVANKWKVAWWVSKVVEVWRGRHLWSQLTTSPTRTVSPAAYHGSGEGPARYR